MKNIFISYSSIDRPDAIEIHRLLQKEDCNVWLDAFDINPSENLEEELFNNIKKADTLCLLLSPSSVTSKWVKKEIEHALIERKQRGLKILAIILRSCEIPDEIKGITALRAYETYEGFKNEYTKLKLIKSIFGQDKVSDIQIDEALQKYYGDLAKQEKAAAILPQLATELDRIRKKPIRSLFIEIDPRIFDQPFFKEDPFILELQLKLNPLFNKPMSFFFAKFQEGNTWPDEFIREFNFEEPPHTIFGFYQHRIDAKFTWYEYVQDLSQNSNLKESIDEPASFLITLDGSEFETPSPKNKFHFNIPLRKTLEIPSLQQLIDDKCEFELITHHPLTKTAKKIDLKLTDIYLKVNASYRLDTGYYDYTLFKSKHEQLENIIMAGNYLSTFENSIERESVLGCYPYDVKKIEAKNSKRWEIHNMLLLDSSEIEWDDDRRLLALLIYERANLANFRKRMIHLFNWEDIPGEGNINLINFLKEDFRRQEHFTYLLYDNEDDRKSLDCKK